MYGILVTVEGDISVIDIDNGELENIYKAIGNNCDIFESVTVDGYIEDAPIMLIDEEGKIKGLPVNYVATQLWHRFRKVNDFLVGNVVITTFDGIDDFRWFRSYREALTYAVTLFPM